MTTVAKQLPHSYKQDHDGPHIFSIFEPKGERTAIMPVNWNRPFFPPNIILGELTNVALAQLFFVLLAHFCRGTSRHCSRHCLQNWLGSCSLSRTTPSSVLSRWFDIPVALKLLATTLALTMLQAFTIHLETSTIGATTSYSKCLGSKYLHGCCVVVI